MAISNLCTSQGIDDDVWQYGECKFGWTTNIQSRGVASRKAFSVFDSSYGLTGTVSQCQHLLMLST